MTAYFALPHVTHVSTTLGGIAVVACTGCPWDATADTITEARGKGDAHEDDARFGRVG